MEEKRPENGGARPDPPALGLPRYPNEFELTRPPSRAPRLVKMGILALVVIGVLGALFLPDSVRKDPTFQMVGGGLWLLAFIGGLLFYLLAVGMEVRRQRRIEREQRPWND
ncbi:MAG TPA: hypothetical protein VFA26_09830 [Gemmataceae bacterium]|nr:hypothetical protein [Gemmataceae bacterium]